MPAARRWKDRLQAQRRPLILVGVAGLLALVGGGWLAGHWGVEETDNAQLQAHLVEISSRLPGTIQAVPVQDNQAVQAGQLLVLLDPRDARAAWVRAQADLLEARQQASAMRSQTQSSASDAAAAEDQATGDRLMARAELDRAGAELRRLEFLLRQGGAARQDVERARATYRKAQGQVSRSEASALLATASARKVTVEQQKAAAAALVHQAEAALQEAALRLS